MENVDVQPRRLGVHAGVVQNDWQTLLPSLERSDFDVTMNGIEVNDETDSDGSGRTRSWVASARRAAEWMRLVHACALSGWRCLTYHHLSDTVP